MFDRIHQFLLFEAGILIIGLFLTTTSNKRFRAICICTLYFSKNLSFLFLSWIYVHIFIHNIFYYLLTFVKMFGDVPCAFLISVMCFLLITFFMC